MDELTKAVEVGDLESVKMILEKSPERIEKKYATGKWAPFIAAERGFFAIVKYIVEYSRASMDEVDENNRTILHYATIFGNLQLVQYLVEKVGMDPLAGDKALQTPFQLAAKHEFSNIENYYETICGFSLKEAYQNPIRRGTFPDPSIVRVGTDYYMVNSSFTFFPCIPISHSKDLIHWEIIGHAIENADWAKLAHLESGRGYWAPDISYYEGKFYITATYRLNDTGMVYRKQMVVSSEKPEGPYCEPVFLEEDGIDPSIFNDSDGKRYMLLNRGARIFQLDKEAKKIVSEPKLLWYGNQKKAPEGPHLLKKDGYYYLFLAEGGTGMGHRISVARCKTIDGRYEPCPYNPIMQQQDANALIQRAGHGKPVQTQQGEWFMVYLCGRKVADRYTMLGRETALDPIQWTADGWPIVNQLKGPSVLQKRPKLTPYQLEEEAKADFEGDVLSKKWMAPRAIVRENCFVKNSQLYIIADGYDLCDLQMRSVLLQRQQSFSFQCTTKMSAHFNTQGQNAGLTCYYDENTYLKFGVFLEDEGYFLKLVERIGTHEAIVYSHEVVYSKAIYLKIECKGLERKFYYSADGVTWTQSYIHDNVYYLSDEGYDQGKRFTGAMIGLYGCGNGLTTQFDYFKLEDIYE